MKDLLISIDDSDLVCANVQHALLCLVCVIVICKLFAELITYIPAMQSNARVCNESPFPHSSGSILVL